MMQPYGQHFLKNKKVLSRIAEELKIEDGDTIIEIGPGHGELTDEILEQSQNKNVRVVVVEKDPALVPGLKEEFGDRVEVREGDALFILPALTEKIGKYKLVGNIPYYITGFLFRKISELDDKPETIIFTIQKEVAERIIAVPPDMNRLSASIQIWAEPKILFTVPKSDFQPSPKIDSAVILLKTLPQNHDSLKEYFDLIRILFQQPRKTILNNLSSGLKELLPKSEAVEMLKNSGIRGEERPQNLSVENILRLSSFLKKTD